MRCPGCGAALSDDQPCRACLLRAVLLETPTDLGEDEGLDPEPPFHVDGYQVLKKIDTGGMGVVYQARCLHAGRLVALKMIRNKLEGDDALRLFQREIAATVLAGAPNIVRLLHAGEHMGRLYYTMPLFESSLAHRLQDFRVPRAAAELMETVARAVQYAHERGVLHLDLKPANVLLDREGPHIADFGLARLLGSSVGVPASTPSDPDASRSHGPSSKRSSARSCGGGTPPYMAPEQEGGAVTTACDVYSLGAILYELLTGVPPEDSRAAQFTVTASSFGRHVERDLAAICRKCMRPERELRYRSARGLADDLSAWRKGEPVTVGAKISLRRVRHLAVRHKLIATLLLLVGVLGVALGVSTQRLQRRTIDTTLLANSYAAQHLAGNVLGVLRDYAAALERLSDDPALIALVTGPPQREAPILKEYVQGFDTIGVYRPGGMRNARWPPIEPDRVVDLHFGWRDYFIQADKAGRAGQRGVYVARCILSEGDGKNKLVFSMPLFDEGQYAGVLMATIDSDRTLKALRMDNSDPEGPTGTLLGLKDRPRSNPSGALPRDYMVVVHEGLSRGKTAEIDHSLAARLLEAWKEPLGAGQQLRPTEPDPILEQDYRDPVPGFEDRWLAGLVQVGRTGLAVVVRTRYRDAVRPSDEMIAQMAWLVLILAGGSIAVVAVLEEARKLRAARAVVDARG